LEAVATLAHVGVAAWRRNPPEVIEARLIALGEDGKELAQGYLGLDSERSHLELVVEREGRPIAAYQTSQGRVKTLVAGRPLIATFAHGGLSPSLWLRFDESTDGKYNLNFGANVRENTHGNLEELLKSLVSSPVLADESSILRWLKHGRHYGSFLETAAPEARQLVWLTPQPDDPGCERVIVSFTGEGRLESIESKWLRVQDIRYGRSSEVVLRPPRWPDLPLREQEEFQAGELFSLAGAGMEALSDAARLAKRSAKASAQQR
jgi:hypothetical protein